MHTYPADEQLIAAVERGLSCEAVVPLPPNGAVVVGDTVLFALCRSHAGQAATFVAGGDSVLVAITGVTNLGVTDSGTGQVMVRLAWDRLGQAGSTPNAVQPRRAVGRK